MNLQGEPSLDKIDDYNNNESPEKRRTVYLVIAGLIIVGIIYATIKANYMTLPDDYVGTPDAPGIDTSKR